MTIRPFRREDTAATIELWKRCALTVPWNDPAKDIQRKLSEHPELFLVCEEDGQLLGTVMGGYDGHRGWINYLAVAPEAQGKGHARALMQALEELLLGMGCPKINLQIRATNQGVIDFYERVGYSDDKVVSMGKRLIPDIAPPGSTD